MKKGTSPNSVNRRSARASASLSLQPWLWYWVRLKLAGIDRGRNEKRQRTDRTPKRSRGTRSRAESARFWSAVSPLPLSHKSFKGTDSFARTPRDSVVRIIVKRSGRQTPRGLAMPQIVFGHAIVYRLEMKSPPVVLVSPSIEKKGEEFGDLSSSLGNTYQQALLRAGCL